jgi:hypothetical protein
MALSSDTQAVLGVLRAQSWERAKGELQAMLQTYYNSDVSYSRMVAAIEALEKEVEDNGLQE